MSAPEPRRFDFKTNAWVRDDFLSGRIVELPTPAAPPAEGRWAVPTPPKPRSLATVALIAVFVAIPLAGFVFGQREGLLGALVADVVGLIYVRNLPERPTHLHAASEDLRLLEASDDPDVCLVEALIVFDGVKVGADRGVAWFEEGALLFSGRRTSFAIGGEDVLPRSYWGEYGRERAGALPDDAIPLRTTSPRTYLILTPLERKDPVAQEQAKRFLPRRKAFRESPTPSSIPRQWPPFTP